MYATQQIRHTGDRPHTVPLPRGPPLPHVLSLRNYHIYDGRGSGIVHAIREERIGNFILMNLT